MMKTAPWPSNAALEKIRQRLRARECAMMIQMLNTPYTPRIIKQDWKWEMKGELNGDVPHA